MLAFGFLGCLSDATGVLAGAAVPAIELMNALYGYYTVLFFLFHLVPYFMALLREEGFIAAFTKPVKQLLQLSFVYFAMQGRMVGQTFAKELSEGGGGYVATGRGLNVEHIPFHKMYAAMSIALYYPAVEMLFLLTTIYILPRPDGVGLSVSCSVFAFLYPVSLLVGPTWFNPHAFKNTATLAPPRPAMQREGDARGTGATTADPRAEQFTTTGVDVDNTNFSLLKDIYPGVKKGDRAFELTLHVLQGIIRRVEVKMTRVKAEQKTRYPDWQLRGSGSVRHAVAYLQTDIFNNTQSLPGALTEQVLKDTADACDKAGGWQVSNDWRLWWNWLTSRLVDDASGHLLDQLDQQLAFSARDKDRTVRVIVRGKWQETDELVTMKSDLSRALAYAHKRPNLSGSTKASPAQAFQSVFLLKSAELFVKTADNTFSERPCNFNATAPDALLSVGDSTHWSGWALPNPQATDSEQYPNAKAPDAPSGMAPPLHRDEVAIEWQGQITSVEETFLGEVKFKDQPTWFVLRNPWNGRLRNVNGEYQPESSWREFHMRKQENKGGVELNSLALPSKELLISLPLLLIVYKSMQPLGWGVLQMVVLALPVVPFVVFVALTGPLQLTYAGRSPLKYQMRVQLLLAGLCAAVLAAEFIVCWWNYELDRARVIAIVGARFFSWRCVFNTALYVSQFVGARTFALSPLEEKERLVENRARTTLNLSKMADGGNASAQPPTQASSYRHIDLVLAIGGAPLAQMASSFALLFDLLLGGVLQLWILLMSVIGRPSWKHRDGSIAHIGDLHERMVFDVNHRELSLAAQTSVRSREASERPGSPPRGRAPVPPPPSTTSATTDRASVAAAAI